MFAKVLSTLVVLVGVLSSPVGAAEGHYLSEFGLAFLTIFLLAWLIVVAQVGQRFKDRDKAAYWNTIGFFTFGIGSVVGYYSEKRAALQAAGVAPPRPALLDRLKRFLTPKKEKGEAVTEDYPVRFYHADGREAEGGDEVEGSVLRLARKIVAEAVALRATDIHIEPRGSDVQTRYRIDGILHSVGTFPTDVGLNLVSSIKVLCDMDIAEKRRSQDGAFSAEYESRRVDIRVASAPSTYGEKLVLRLLDKSRGLKKLESLGLTTNVMAELRRIVHLPYGMLIVSGPTGSGKTTTLYACLGELDAKSLNIITIENPIEYRMDGINQTAINEKAGITFASVLRASLRQDPNVIMIGEIRDTETAQVSLQAAMTGHFVFTTVHANDAVATIVRLLDLGAEPFLVASSLSAVLAQRLVRRLCTKCRRRVDPPPPEFVSAIGWAKEKIQYFEAVGCNECFGTGYKGRAGIYELLVITPEIRDMIQAGDIQMTEMRKVAIRNGMIPLNMDGMYKVAFGLTSVDEVNRVSVG